MYRTLISVVLAFVVLPACRAQEERPGSRGLAEAYWYRGKAEVATYDLVQSRYGQERAGHAVLVFVTEPFRVDIQVKDERGGAPDRSTSVLKLNRIQRFTTGVYDYSMMQSVFTPTAGGRTIKTTTSVQDWCGQVWAQLNLEPDAYRLTGHSYFEGEGEEDRRVPAAMLEDELFNRVRIDPSSLPIGRVRVLPGMFDARLRHVPLAPQDAKAERVAGASAKVGIYRLTYTSGRTYEIEYELAAPHGIVRFREAVGGQVTEARRRAVQRRAYWNESGRGFAEVRAGLGLQPKGLALEASR